MSQFNALRRQSIAQRARKSFIEDPRNLQRILQAELQDFRSDANEQKDPQFEKKLKLRKLRLVTKIIDTTSFLLATAGVLIATWDYELFYDDGEGNHFKERGSKGKGLQALVSITTAALMVTMIIHSILSYRVEKIKNPNYKNVSYWRSRFSKQLLIEIIINGIHCPPGFDTTFQVNQLDIQCYYSLSGVLLNCMFIRFYILFRIFAVYSKWTSEMAQESCEPEGCDADTIFAMKAVLKEKPYTALSMLMATTIVIFGLVMRNFERPVYLSWDPNSSGYQDYDFIWNGMWLIAITMTTGNY